MLKILIEVDLDKMDKEDTASLKSNILSEINGEQITLNNELGGTTLMERIFDKVIHELSLNKNLKERLNIKKKSTNTYFASNDIIKTHSFEL